MIQQLSDGVAGIALWAVVPLLALLFYVASELGFRYHRRFVLDRESATDEGQVLSTALLVLALLLGFTFSMALMRFDERRQLVVQESNDIGTAWLRAGLVADPHRAALQSALTAYAQVRKTSPLPHETAKLARAAALRERMWRETLTAQATLDGPRAVSLVAAVNAVIDTATLRERAVAAQVPAALIIILVLFAVVAAFLLGYVLEAQGDRHRFASLVLFVLMGLTLMLILDLDRPSEGLIQVDQTAMLDTAATLAKFTAATATGPD